MTRGILSQRIVDTPVAVIDFETTGLTPGIDRVVEVSVVRIEPGQAPRVVYGTPINPNRPMAATFVHGISDADVVRAPRFEDVVGDLLAATKDCVTAADNVYFDIKFLNFELASAGVVHAARNIGGTTAQWLFGCSCKLAGRHSTDHKVSLRSLERRGWLFGGATTPRNPSGYCASLVETHER